MPLSNQNPSMMDTLRQAQLVDASLQAALQKVLHTQREHVIKFHTGFVEDTNTNETADHSVSFKEAARVFLVEGEQLTALIDQHI